MPTKGGHVDSKGYLCSVTIPLGLGWGCVRVEGTILCCYDSNL